MSSKLLQRQSSNGSVDVPTHWLNMAASLPWELPPVQDRYGQKASLSYLRQLYTEECACLEAREGPYARELWLPIPEPVLGEYRKYRPTPLLRAAALEEWLGYRGRIYVKREDVNPAGSHKPNTAIPQAYYARLAGIRELVTDTGAGQWGSALAWACQAQGLACTVFMTRNSYEAKPYRRDLMILAGARVYPSPSEVTTVGRRLLEQDVDHQGSLGIGMSEAMEYAQGRADARLALGCMSYFAAVHQTVIGQELALQLEREGVEPDILVGCVGGGSNFLGFIAPFVLRHFTGPEKGQGTRFVAVESANIPALTKGQYRYDYADTLGLGPRVLMYTLGHDFLPPRIHAGGLRYHGKSPLLSLLVRHGLVEARAIDQESAFRAGQLFFKVQGILPAPESSHALAQLLIEVEEAKKQGRTPSIVCCLSGTGYLDLGGYRSVLSSSESD